MSSSTFAELQNPATHSTGRHSISFNREAFFWEYEAVLKREKILELLDVSLEEVDLVLAALLAIARRSNVHYLWRPNLQDEGDNHVLESAVASGAIIITKNIRDFFSSDLRFPELVILTPQQFCDIYL